MQIFILNINDVHNNKRINWKIFITNFDFKIGYNKRKYSKFLLSCESWVLRCKNPYESTLSADE